MESRTHQFFVIWIMLVGTMAIAAFTTTQSHPVIDWAMRIGLIAMMAIEVIFLGICGFDLMWDKKIFWTVD
jgi:energy-converting hydrogenase Eha subunit H